MISAAGFLLKYSLVQLLKSLDFQIEEMEKRISGMVTSSKDEFIDEQRKSELVAKGESYRRHYKERKRIADRIVDAVSENVSISKKKLMVSLIVH